MHAQPGFIGYKTCRRLEGYFCSDTSIIRHNCCKIYRQIKHEATPGHSTDWRVSLLLNLSCRDLGDDILVLIHPDWLLPQTNVEVEFSIASQETFLRETEERGDWNEEKRNVSFDLVFSDGEFHWYFQLSSSVQKRIIQDKNKKLYSGNGSSKIGIH